MCNEHCSEEGAVYMGLKFGYQCSCGDESEAEALMENGLSDDCDRDCLGDFTDDRATCGTYNCSRQYFTSYMFVFDFYLVTTYMHQAVVYT